MHRSNLYRQHALAAALAAAGVVNGTAFETGGSPQPYKEFGAYFFSTAASAADGAKLQISNDGVTWVTVAQATLAANVPQSLSTPILAKYHRATLTNGAGAATATVVDFVRVL